MPNTYDPHDSHGGRWHVEASSTAAGRPLGRGLGEADQKFLGISEMAELDVGSNLSRWR
jgi:hypothetical protein